MLLGTGPFVDLASQLTDDPRAHEPLSLATQRVWVTSPERGNPQGPSAQGHQGPTEPCPQFVHLTRAVRRQVAHSQAADILIKQLAYENANKACKRAVVPVRNSGGISAFIKGCQDVGSRGLCSSSACCSMERNP